MEVIVKEKKYIYESDYPDKWAFAHGDHFKIVKLDNGKYKATCFVKRFEVKTPKSISGWGLMKQLEGKNIGRLARLYNIVDVEENRRTVYYVFSEYIEGETLHNLISKNASVDLEKLADSLFDATAILQEKNYWFPDFTEKNIFYSKRAGFVLIDLDSTQPVSVVPDKDIWGEKEYWALVFDFYKKFLHKDQLIPSDIHGTTLTYLCIVFLLLRIKIFQTVNTQEYAHLYEDLTSFLNNTSPSFAIIFNSVFHDKESPPKPDDIDEIIRLVRENILPLTEDSINDIIEGKVSYLDPVIKKFTVNNFEEKSTGEKVVVENGEKFTLNWQVENATHVELYKDGDLFHTGKDDKSIELTEEVWDQDERQTEFTLVALNDFLVKTSASLTITIVNNREPEPVIKRFTVTDYFEETGKHRYIVEIGKSFVLNWEVEYASLVELYKNGTLYRKYSDENRVELTEELNDDTEKEIEYILVASNSSLEKTPSYLFVSLIDNRVPEPVIVEPVIKRFLVTDYLKKIGRDHYTVATDHTFVLGWEVENASSIELYKNGKQYRIINGEKGNIELKKNSSDATGTRISYLLKAFNDGITVESNPITVEFILQPPSINDFKASKIRVTSGKPFQLSWDAANVTGLQLLRNGKVFQTPDPSESSIELFEEKQPGNEEEIIYTLLATSDSQKVKSEPVIITLVDRKKWGIARTAILSAIVLLIIAGIYWYISSTPTPAPKIAVDRFTPKTITQSDTITIFGKNLPENSGSVQVEFGNVPGKILQQTRDSLRVQVPAPTSDGSINISVYANGAFFNTAENVLYAKPAKVIPPTLLPLTLHEIWRSSSGNHFMYIDLLQKLIYYSSGDRNRYDTASISNATYDNTNGLYKIAITTDGADKLLFIKNSTPQSFEVCICPNQPQAVCNDFTKMFLYYENNPSLIFLPASVSELSPGLDPSQSRRLFGFVNRQTNKNWLINVFNVNPFIQPSSLDPITGLLNERGIKYSVAQGNTDLPGNNPFRRNYITLTPKKIDSSKTATTSTTSTTTGTTGTTGATAGVASGTAADPGIEIANGFDLGYLRFNARNEPDDVSKEILGVIAAQLREDNVAKITFYATWSNKADEAAVSANVSSLKNYLNRINIRLDSRQVDTKITSSTMARYNKSIHVVGFKFPRGFNLEKKLGEFRMAQQKLEQTNKKIKSIRDNLDIAFRFKDGMAYCSIANNSPFDIDKVEVEISYLPQFENDPVKKMLNFENVKAKGGSTLEAPFLINSHQVEYSFRSVVPKESD
ncbi:MAG: IPT/TIG domain-containing protein [Chitinophagaceae bacterium]